MIKEKLHILPNGNAILLSMVSCVEACPGCEDQTLLQTGMVVYGLHGSVLTSRIKASSFDEAKQWRDDLIKAVNESREKAEA